MADFDIDDIQTRAGFEILKHFRAFIFFDEIDAIIHDELIGNRLTATNGFNNRDTGDHQDICANRDLPWYTANHGIDD